MKYAMTMAVALALAGGPSLAEAPAGGGLLAGGKLGGGMDTARSGKWFGALPFVPVELAGSIRGVRDDRLAGGIGGGVRDDRGVRVSALPLRDCYQRGCV